MAVSDECGVANVRLLAHPCLLCYPDCYLLSERYCKGGRGGERRGRELERGRREEWREGGRWK